jgi:hypothetical protein
MLGPASLRGSIEDTALGFAELGVRSREEVAGLGGGLLWPRVRGAEAGSTS